MWIYRGKLAQSCLYYLAETNEPWSRRQRPAFVSLKIEKLHIHLIVVYSLGTLSHERSHSQTLT